MTTTQHPPAPPSLEERRLYYFNIFPACPRLVARSSTFVWEHPRKPGSVMYLTRLRYDRRDSPFFRLWENWKSGLIIQLMRIAERVNYTFMETARVEINGESHDTLMIGVEPDSLSWERGYALALRCKAVLEERGIHNVHCEIREARGFWW
ncbi:uncharacterized protein TrAFT101_011487 [Trichoderma asperellum]|uniref:uncharacterized protein n=1 Tax=Trichoderma asperellum TaxID=101201 RepID=UPI00332E46C6|nr:hypothetical protein TrAFT101_011487 [Trichoderma asperellum]